MAGFWKDESTGRIVIWGDGRKGALCNKRHLAAEVQGLKRLLSKYRRWLLRLGSLYCRPKSLWDRARWWQLGGQYWNWIWTEYFLAWFSSFFCYLYYCFCDLPSNWKPSWAIHSSVRSFWADNKAPSRQSQHKAPRSFYNSSRVWTCRICSAACRARPSGSAAHSTCPPSILNDILRLLGTSKDSVISKKFQNIKESAIETFPFLSARFRIRMKTKSIRGERIMLMTLD